MNDDDIKSMTRTELQQEVIRLRNGLKKFGQLADDILNNQEIEMIDVVEKAKDDLNNLTTTVMDKIEKFVDDKITSEQSEMLIKKMTKLKDKIGNIIDEIKK